MTAKQFGKLITLYFAFAWVEQIYSYSKWSNRRQWRDKSIRGLLVIGSVIVVVVAWWSVGIGQITLLNWYLPAFLISIILNILFVGVFSRPGMFSIPDREPLLHSNEPLPYSEVADPTPEKFVLGDRGKEHGGYWWIEWLSPTQEQHFRIVGGVGYGRDQLKRLALQNSFTSPTIAFMCDWTTGGGESFRDFIGTKGIIVVEAQHRIAKAIDFVYDIYQDRYSLRCKPDEYDNSTRILLFIDESLMELLEHPDADTPSSMTKIGAQLMELATNAKSHNIHIIAYAPPHRGPNSMRADLQAHFKDIVYSFAIKVEKPEGGFGMWQSQHPAFYSVVAVKHQHELYIMKVPTVSEAPKAWIESQFESFGEAVHDMYVDAVKHCNKGKYEAREKREIVVAGETVKATEWQAAA